jgi:hypothetical protein
MKTLIFLSVAIVLSATALFGQTNDTVAVFENTAEKIMKSNDKLNIGGYGEVHFNQPMKRGTKENGTLDVHRIVMFLGYNFDSKTQFVTEIEFEYAKELWVEQAFLQHKINPYLNFRAGLLLVPMGIINEYHEPTTFHGVERPIIDNKIAPSTWREIGAGFTGNILPLSIKYQAYVVGGLNGYDTKGIFSGNKGLREGRQKGSKAYVSSPAFAGKVEYFGLRNLNLGLSGYFGKSQSKLFGGVNRDSTSLLSRADSSVVGISMIGMDARYQMSGLELRGQFYFANMSNTNQYNVFTATNGALNDLGSQMIGYYAEAGYNVFKHFGSVHYELIPFLRYEFYNTHHSVVANLERNKKYSNTMITTGLTFKLTQNAVIKTDLQLAKSESETEWTKVFNAGIGVMF